MTRFNYVHSRVYAAGRSSPHREEKCPRPQTLRFSSRVAGYPLPFARVYHVPLIYPLLLLFHLDLRARARATVANRSTLIRQAAKPLSDRTIFYTNDNHTAFNYFPMTRRKHVRCGDEFAALRRPLAANYLVTCAWRVKQIKCQSSASIRGATAAEQQMR